MCVTITRLRDQLRISNVIVRFIESRNYLFTAEINVNRNFKIMAIKTLGVKNSKHCLMSTYIFIIQFYGEQHCLIANR